MALRNKRISSTKMREPKGSRVLVFWIVFRMFCTKPGADAGKKYTRNSFFNEDTLLTR